MSVRVVFDPISDSGNIRHIGTSWELSKDPEFIDESKLISRSLNDEINLNSIVFEYNILDDDVLFARAKVHFNDVDNSESGWDIIEIDSDNKGFTFEGTIIETPIINVETNYDGKISLDILNINISEYNLLTGSDPHKSTSYRIRDVDGNIILKRDEDEDNLYSIVFPSGTLKQARVYTIEARFVSEHGSKSSYGKKTVVTTTENSSSDDGSSIGPVIANTAMDLMLQRKLIEKGIINE